MPATSILTAWQIRLSPGWPYLRQLLFLSDFPELTLDNLFEFLQSKIPGEKKMNSDERSLWNPVWNKMESMTVGLRRVMPLDIIWPINSCWGIWKTKLGLQSCSGCYGCQIGCWSLLPWSCTWCIWTTYVCLGCLLYICSLVAIALHKPTIKTLSTLPSAIAATSCWWPGDWCIGHLDLDALRNVQVRAQPWDRDEETGCAAGNGSGWDFGILRSCRTS